MSSVGSFGIAGMLGAGVLEGFWPSNGKLEIAANVTREITNERESIRLSVVEKLAAG